MTADDYVRHVERALGDLPWNLRRDLIAELRGHLTELPPDTNLGERLGAPEQYVAELRAAAGLNRRRGVIAFIRARRPRNVVIKTIAVMLTLTVIGLGIGAVVWIDRYQPLGFVGGVSAVPDGAHSLLGLDGEAVTFREGKPFVLGLEIANTGPFAVRVLGVPYPSIEPWTAHILMATIRHAAGPYTGPLTRFHPFDLQAGEHSYLLLKGVWACHSGMTHGALTFDSFTVRYSFHWHRATAEIPLPDGTLAVQFKTGCTPGGDSSPKP